MAPLLKFSLPTAGGGGGGTTPPAGGATVSGAWARYFGLASLLAIGSNDAGVTTGTAGKGSDSTMARGRPSVTAGRVLAITWRARTTAGGGLVGLQSPSSARAPAMPSHSPRATLRPAIVLPFIGLPFFPGCVTSWTAKTFDCPRRTLHPPPASGASRSERRQGHTEALPAVQVQPTPSEFVPPPPPPAPSPKRRGGDSPSTPPLRSGRG